jgi:hypothetical protein
MAYRFTRSHFGGGVWARVLRASASLDFPSVAAAGTADLTITVPGCVVGDDVQVSITAAPTTTLRFVAWVSAADTVTVRAINHTAGAIDQAATVYRVLVFKAS